MRFKMIIMVGLFLIGGCADDSRLLSENQDKDHMSSSIERFSSLFEEDILNSSTEHWTLISHAKLKPYSAYYNHHTIQTKNNLKTVLWLDLFYPPGLNPITVQSVYEFDCSSRDSYRSPQSKTEWVETLSETPSAAEPAHPYPVIAPPTKEKEYLELQIEEQKINRPNLESQVWSELCEKTQEKSNMKFSQVISKETKRLESLSNPTR